jgi:hypothetical protein
VTIFFARARVFPPEFPGKVSVLVEKTRACTRVFRSKSKYFDHFSTRRGEKIPDSPGIPGNSRGKFPGFPGKVPEKTAFYAAKVNISADFRDFGGVTGGFPGVFPRKNAVYGRIVNISALFWNFRG